MMRASIISLVRMGVVISNRVVISRSLTRACLGFGEIPRIDQGKDDDTFSLLASNFIEFGVGARHSPRYCRSSETACCQIINTEEMPLLIKTEKTKRKRTTSQPSVMQPAQPCFGDASARRDGTRCWQKAWEQNSSGGLVQTVCIPGIKPGIPVEALKPQQGSPQLTS